MSRNGTFVTPGPGPGPRHDAGMGEKAAVDASDTPRTRASLTVDLRALGVAESDVLLVHSSLSSVGWVCGGAVAVVGALLDVLGPEGTLVVPTHTAGNSDPANWANPPIPHSWWATVRANMPAFEPLLTPSTGVGAVPELVRTWPGAMRSEHPQMSFAAVGPHAEQITAGHALESGMGEESPLRRLYDLDARILLLGTGHASNSSFHLAEYRVPAPRRHQTAAAVMTRSGRAWIAYDDVDLDSDDFEELGAAFDATGRTRRGRVGAADARLIRQRDAVDFAVGWLKHHR
jgi:aminoglycoside 3-N-acetyltransferase